MVQLFLNSEYNATYQNGSKHSDIIFHIRKPIRKIKSIKVGSFVFPVSFTNINSTNNSLFVDGVEYTIPVGNYTATTLIDALETLLGAYYSITFSSTTLKYTFTNSNDDFTIEKESTCLYILGFEKSTDNASTTNVLVSTYPINLSSSNVIYIDISNFKSNDNINGVLDTKTSIISCIPVDSNAGGIVYYSNADNIISDINEDTISFLRIRILDEDTQTSIDFNNQHWKLTLLLNK